MRLIAKCKLIYNGSFFICYAGIFFTSAEYLVLVSTYLYSVLFAYLDHWGYTSIFGKAPNTIYKQVVNLAHFHCK